MNNAPSITSDGRSSDDPDDGPLPLQGSDPEATGLEIAIVGMAGRFPGAADIDAFWNNIRHGVESVVQYSDETLRNMGVPESLLNDLAYVKAGVPFDGMDLFDAGFFGFTPHDAEQTDPQHRLFLECAATALQHAGYDPQRYPGRIGVYGGSGTGVYLIRNVLPRHRLDEATGVADVLALLAGNTADSLCTTVAYRLGLRGPAVTVQTACSTSLTAVHLACQALQGNECDVALAGGVSLNLLQKGGYLHQAGAILSPDGHCRAFDARAAGTLIGSGVGIVVLKRLEDALAEGDTIHAVIKGSAVNNDGADKIGHTAPSVSGQAAVIRAAQAVADVSPDTVSYVEAHGTGTVLGDPVEAAALIQAFRAGGTQRSGYCALGSVKTNIGHLDAAAGVAGLIKMVLALRHRILPPSLNFETPNPEIDFGNSPFRVNTTARPWPADNGPRRAGVSSFGIGGTNVHVVLEEAPQPETRQPHGVDAGASASERLQEERQMSFDGPVSRRCPESSRSLLLLLSARSPQALHLMGRDLAGHLQRTRGLLLDDVAHTLREGRIRFEHRAVALVQRIKNDSAESSFVDKKQRFETNWHDPAGLQVADILQQQPSGLFFSGRVLSEHPTVAFLFPGQGAQHIDMARMLYEHERVFRDVVDQCCEGLKPHLGQDLRRLLYPLHDPHHDDPHLDGAAHDGAGHDDALAAEALAQTAITQPALFVVSYAMARWWQAQGIQPDALLGHSIGEYVAACLAGVFSLEDALRVVAARGRLLQAMAPGAMLAVGLSEERLRSLGHAGCDVAAVNAPERCVLAGPHAAIAAVEENLQRQGVVTRRLHVSHAFHSAMVEPMLTEFEALLSGIRLSPPRIPVASNLSGQWLQDADATSPRYWSRHVRGTVRFADGLSTLLAKPDRVLLEVGPGETLSVLARRHPGLGATRPVLASQCHPGRDARENADQPTRCLAQLWVAGIDIDQAGHGRSAGRRVPLPTYPFERRSYWIDPADDFAGSRLSDWFLAPLWKRDMSPGPYGRAPQRPVPGCILVLGQPGLLQRALVAGFQAQGSRVIQVARGTAFQVEGKDGYRVRPDSREDLEKLLNAVHADAGTVTDILHLWSLDRAAACHAAQQDVLSGSDDDPSGLDEGFFSLMALAQALDTMATVDENITDGTRLSITIVTSGLADVTGTEALIPDQATLYASCLVIPQEHPDIRCRLIDVELPSPMDASSSDTIRRIVDQVQDGVLAVDGEDLVAYRGAYRWKRTFESVSLPNGSVAPVLRRQGVYLITGGLGGVGMAMAEHLARQWQVRLVLVSRQVDSDKTRQAVNRLQTLGAEVEVMPADVTDALQMQHVVDATVRRFGGLHGVIHAAGVPGGGRMADRDRFAAERVIGPKRQGSINLLRALMGRDVDFVLLCSSLTAIVGGYGQLDYCAANGFQDALAAWCARNALGRVVSVDWDSWRGVGMAAGQRLPNGQGIDAIDAGMLLETVLALPGPQILVSTMPLAQQFDWVRSAGAADSVLAEQPTIRGTRQPRPSIDTPYAQPENGLEEGLAATWSELLGMAPVGVEDSLFDLGGDSLLAIQMLARVRSLYGTGIHPAGFFRQPTIRSLAELIEIQLIEEIEGTESERNDR